MQLTQVPLPRVNQFQFCQLNPVCLPTPNSTASKWLVCVPFGSGLLHKFQAGFFLPQTTPQLQGALCPEPRSCPTSPGLLERGHERDLITLQPAGCSDPSETPLLWFQATNPCSPCKGFTDEGGRGGREEKREGREAFKPQWNFTQSSKPCLLTSVFTLTPEKRQKTFTKVPLPTHLPTG